MAHCRSFRSTRPSSLKTWFPTNLFGVPQAQLSPLAAGPSGTFSGGVIFATEVFTQDVTILRTRGQISVAAEDIAAGDLYMVAYGIGIAEETALDAFAVPVPITDADWDGWMLHQTIYVRGEPSGVGESAASDVSIEIDSKAMRKIQSGNGIFISAQSQTIVGAGGTLNAALFARFLLKTSN